MTFAPVINASSARLLEDSAQMPGSFLHRQRFFHDLKQQRMRMLQAEVRPVAAPTPLLEQGSGLLSPFERCRPCPAVLSTAGGYSSS